MKTKIVYVVASLDDDVYMEQAIVSAWSVRHYNPDCHIEMVCDQDTVATLDSGIRAQYKNLFDEIHVREFKQEQSMMERSRWMKTSLREIIVGDFLYLDTDTVVCADLSCVDDFDFDFGMVLDQNCDFRTFIFRPGVVNRIKSLFGVDISQEQKYFNSGVAFVKDSIKTHDFYHTWHQLWQKKRIENGWLKDQDSLAISNIKHGYLITELSGDFNCQVMMSVQYLHTAKIMHYFNTLTIAPNNIHPFYGDKLFLRIKSEGITEEIQNMILNNKSLFTSPSMPASREGAVLWLRHQTARSAGLLNERIIYSNSYYALCLAWQHFPRVMRFVEKVCGKIVRKHRKPKNKVQ